MTRVLDMQEFSIRALRAMISSSQVHPKALGLNAVVPTGSPLNLLLDAA